MFKCQKCEVKCRLSWIDGHRKFAFEESVEDEHSHEVDVNDVEDERYRLVPYFELRPDVNVRFCPKKVFFLSSFFVFFRVNARFVTE